MEVFGCCLNCLQGWAQVAPVQRAEGTAYPKTRKPETSQNGLKTEKFVLGNKM
jgi:hypothetical protein